jgi:Tfp pilus assembly protein PilN
MRAVNLIPGDQRRGASVGLGRSQGAAYALLAVVAILALFGFLYGKASHTISSSRSQLATIEAQVQQAKSDASSLAGYEALNGAREKRVKAVQELVDSRFDWGRVLHEFGRVLPRHVSITSLTGGVGSTTAAASAPVAGASATVTSATPPGSIPTFTLGGCAHSQDEVAQTLQRLRLIDGVTEVVLQSSSDEGAPGASKASASTGCGQGASFQASVVFTPLPASSAYPAAKTVADPGVAAQPKPKGRAK